MSLKTYVAFATAVTLGDLTMNSTISAYNKRKFKRQHQLTKKGRKKGDTYFAKKAPVCHIDNFISYFEKYAIDDIYCNSHDNRTLLADEFASIAENTEVSRDITKIVWRNILGEGDKRWKKDDFVDGFIEAAAKYTLELEESF